MKRKSKQVRTPTQPQKAPFQVRTFLGFNIRDAVSDILWPVMASYAQPGNGDQGLGRRRKAMISRYGFFY